MPFKPFCILKLIQYDVTYKGWTMKGLDNNMEMPLAPLKPLLR